MYCEGNGENEEQARREEGPELRNENKASTGTFLRSRVLGQMSLTAPSPAMEIQSGPSISEAPVLISRKFNCFLIWTQYK